MKALEQRILTDGKVLEGDVLIVGNFLNQQIDSAFTMEMAREVADEFASDGVTKVLTVESSGIAFGYAVAYLMNVPLVFAKKSRSSNQPGNVLSAKIHSYTHSVDYTATVAEEYIKKTDRVLIADDFLANGEALTGLMEIVAQAGASLAGCTVQIEKGFQHGGDRLREQGIKLKSLAVIDSMDGGKIVFRDENN